MPICFALWIILSLAIEYVEPFRVCAADKDNEVLEEHWLAPKKVNSFDHANEMGAWCSHAKGAPINRQLDQGNPKRELLPVFN